jgi:ribonucleoside-diphosphate reductase alpha chain
MATVKPALNGKAVETANEMKRAGTKSGLRFERYFTDGRTSPFNNVEWEKRTALIGNEKGVTIFKQENVEVPKSWSQTATNIVASKYFHGKVGTPERETSVRHLISRVVNTVVRWGEEGGYFTDTASRDAFRDELTHLLVEQKMSFNSPVWFNVGVQAKPQCSACFINSVQDNMESIMGLTRTEGMLFKWGSGTGTNFSALRGSKETLSGGGIASGPVSFMKGFDAFAGVIKSGGKTRRAAKMVILNVDHPDIVEFIECKVKEEKKAHVLIEQGYDSRDRRRCLQLDLLPERESLGARDDEFMRAVVEDRDWWTKNVNDGQPNEKYRAARPDGEDRRIPPGSAAIPACSTTRHKPLAHLQEHGAHQREQSLQRIHVPGRHGVQPGVAESDEVSGEQRAVSTWKRSGTPWT